MRQINYYVERHPGGTKNYKPFPGKAKWRWRIYDLITGLEPYKGKPSKQVLEQLRRISAADMDKMFRIYIMDRVGTWLTVDIRQQGHIVYNTWNGQAFQHYTGVKDYRVLRAVDIENWFLEKYGRKGEQNGVQRREEAIPQPVGR